MLRPARRDKFRLAGATTRHRRAFPHADTQARLQRQTGFPLLRCAGPLRVEGLCAALGAPGMTWRGGMESGLGPMPFGNSGGF
jgi:hypothetical protein